MKGFVNSAEPKSPEELTYLTAQPSLLVGGQLKAYQLVGLNWLISLYDLGINGILADEMGLGKTIQVIAFLAYLAEFRQLKGPHLIVCPNTVLLNWHKEFRKWLPSLRVVKLFARKEAREETVKTHLRTRNFDVLLTTYEGVNICCKELRRIDWNYIIVDEAHRLKNETSLLSQNLRKVPGELKMLLTGTPLQNNLKELWALLNFLLPELFDDAQLFEPERYNEGEAVDAETQEKRNLELIQSLHKVLRPFVLRRSKDSVELRLPPKTETHLYVGLTELQLRMYKTILLKKPLSEDASAARNILMQLRKCCNHPFLFPGVEDEQGVEADIVGVSGKMLVLDKLLARLRKSENRQVLIFSQFTSMLTLIERYVLERGWEYCRIDGSTPTEEREEQIEDFTREGSDKFIFLLSTRAGGLGINLATADTVVVFDSDWNPQVDLQAMDRAHRIGQKKEVQIYRLIAESTVEEKMVERQKVKMRWDSLVVLKGRGHAKHALSKKELADLLNFGANRIFRSETGTFRDEDIDELLTQGARRTAELETRIEEAFRGAQGALSLDIKSINVYEFGGDDYHNRRADEEALRLAIEGDFELRKLKKRAISAAPPPRVEPIRLPEYQLYPNRVRLEALLSSATPLSAAEIAEREQLLAAGFPLWNRADFNAALRAVEKYGEGDIAQIARATRKDEEETKRYISALFARLDQLSEHEKIRRGFERGERARAARANREAILRKKCFGVQSFEQLNFEGFVYSKVKSRLFTSNNDKFLVFASYTFGAANVRQIRAAFVAEPLFRFDFYAKALRESALAKRISSLLKMLQNEENCLRAERRQSLQRRSAQKAAKAPTLVAPRKKKIARAATADAPPAPRKTLKKTKGARKPKSGASDIC